MNYLFDTCVAADLIFERENYLLAEHILVNPKNKIFISSQTPGTLCYLAKHYKCTEEKVVDYLELFEIVEITQLDFYLAKQIWQKEDFEDALQVALAIRKKLNLITTDKKLFKKYQELLDIVLL